jgi:hypothetical protein
MAIPLRALPTNDCQHCELRPFSSFCNFSPPALADYNLIGAYKRRRPGQSFFVKMTRQIKFW